MHEYSNILFKRKIFKIFLELKSKKKPVFILKTDSCWQWMHVNARIVLCAGHADRTEAIQNQRKEMLVCLVC